MMKIIIVILILLTFPIFSRADGGVLEGMSIGANASIDTQIDTSVSTSSDSANIESQSNNISATTTTETEVEGDGFFRRVINWFKGLFGFN